MKGENAIIYNLRKFLAKQTTSKGSPASSSFRWTLRVADLPDTYQGNEHRGCGAVARRSGIAGGRICLLLPQPVLQDQAGHVRHLDAALALRRQRAVAVGGRRPFLHAIGLPELVTASLTDYEALALRLATEPALLAKAKLAAHRSTYPVRYRPLSPAHRGGLRHDVPAAAARRAAGKLHRYAG
jgi:hypothetical protein